MRVSVQSRAAVAGIAAAIAGLGVAELVAALVATTSSPLFVVGALAIDLAPGWLKEFVISIVGTADKPVLLVTLAVVAAAVTALAGMVELRRPPLGRVLIALVAVPAVLAAVTRADAGALASAPSIAGAVTAILVLPWLVGRLRQVQGHRPRRQPRPPPFPDRRRRHRGSRRAHARARTRARRGPRSRREGEGNVPPAEAGGSRGGDSLRRAPGGGGHQPAHHTERVLLPHRHGTAGAEDRRVRVEAEDHRDGGASGDAVVRRAHRVAAGGEPHDARVRVELRRRRPHRHGHVARLSDPETAGARPAASGCRHGALHERRRVHRRHAAVGAHRRAERDPRGRA